MAAPKAADREAGGDTYSFYDGKAVLKKRMYGTAPSFRRVDGQDTILSVTRCTGKLDKSKALIPWSVGLVGTHIRSHFESLDAPHFMRDEILMVVGEAILAPDRAKEAGADTGTLIHDYAHEFAQMKIDGKKGTPSLKHLDEKNEEHVKALNGIYAFLEWYNSNDVQFLEMEKMVYYNSRLAGDSAMEDPIVEFYGYIDLIARVNGELVVVDYKSSKGVYNEQRYQVAAYKMAFNAPLKGGSEFALSSQIVNFNKLTGELITKKIGEGESELDYAAFLGLYAVSCRERVLEKEYKDSKKTA